MEKRSPLIDISLKELQLKRAAPHFKKHDFLFRHGEEELSARTEELKKIEGHILNLSFWPLSLGDRILPPQSPLVNFTPQPPYDVIVSCLSLHWVEDLPGLLKGLHGQLTEDGLFIATFLAGDTLKELRESFLKAELDIYGGASPRILPFVRPEDGPKLMAYAGFHEPVIDQDTIQVEYTSLGSLLTDLRGMGESNALYDRRRQNDSASFFSALKNHYRAHFGPEGPLPATFEFLTLTGWKTGMKSF